MTVGGAGCVIVGGLVAAVTGPSGLEQGSWLAAYLVLVCGVGGYAIGAVQARPESPPMPPARTWTQLTCWGVGNAAVITGSLTGVTVLVDAGAVLLVVALMIALVRAGWRGPPVLRLGGGLVGWAYRCLLVILMISAPVGAVLAHMRSTG